MKNHKWIQTDIDVVECEHCNAIFCRNEDLKELMLSADAYYEDCEDYADERLAEGQT